MARDCITVTVCPETGFSLKGEIDFTLDFSAFLIKKLRRFAWLIQSWVLRTNYFVI